MAHSWTQVLLQAYIVGLFLVLETPSLAVAQTNSTFINPPSDNVFCNGSEVIFTCETRGSATLDWRGDSFYVGSTIGLPEFLNINSTMPSSTNNNTIATLTENYQDDGGVRVLVSTLRITALSAQSSGNVTCAVPGDPGQRFNFQTLGAPIAPPAIVTFKFENVRDICIIASVLPSLTDPAEADATNYTVRVGGSSVPHNNTVVILSDGTRRSILLYNSSCGAGNISISDNNMCGESPGTEVIMVDPELPFVLNRTLFGGANNIECSVMAVIMGVVLVVSKYLLDLELP